MIGMVFWEPLLRLRQVTLPMVRSSVEVGVRILVGDHIVGGRLLNGRAPDLS